MTTRYFMAFAAKDDLKQAADKVLELREQNASESWVPYFDDMIDLFIPAFLDNMLVDTCDTVGLSPRASKIIHSSCDTLSHTISTMIAKLIKKRSNEEMIPMVEFTDDVYLRAENCSTGRDSVGFQMDKAHYDKIQYLLKEVRGGNLEEVRDDLIDIMIDTVDIAIENMMVRIINLLKINFVVRKLCDAAVATSRGACHLVVHKVFKNLDEESMLRLGDFFEGLLVTEER